MRTAIMWPGSPTTNLRLEMFELLLVRTVNPRVMFVDHTGMSVKP